MMEYPRLLDNKPCGQDLFEGKSHNAIAKNIANVLATSSDKIIGIDGSWGSGKSNMVNIIKEELEKKEKNKFHFYIYDAWGYQTDFQRRSILENLTSFLIDEAKILDKKKWNAKLLQLLSRKRSVGTKVVKELSAVAKVSAIIAFAIPLLIFFNDLINNNVFKFVYWIIIFILSLLLLLYFQIRNMKKYGQQVSFSNIIHELFLSYIDYTHEKSKDSIEQSIKYETIYDEEPSTRDFKNWMDEIDKDIKKHKLIIVFDNMDRLPHEKVQELWSAIHTFFAEKKYNNISVIIPFDREHINSAFKSEDIISGHNNANQNNENVPPKLRCYGNDFINKTFDAVYRVSPPVMSDWKKYFSYCWKESFGTEVDGKITQIYDLLSEIITPREIIAFINEFVLIKQTSDKTIPDEYIALFIKGKDVISLHPQEEILNPTYLGAMNFMYQNDPALPKYISSLYYQLPAENALDIVYTENLKRALDNCDIDQIKSIQSSPNLFFNLLENAITKVSNYSNSILALNKCFTNEYPQKELMIWDCIYENTKQHISENTLQDYHKVLLNNITQKEELLKLLIFIFSNHKEFNVVEYYNSINQISEIEGIDPFEHLQEKEVEPSEFIIFVEESKDSFLNYKISCNSEELDKYLSELEIERLSNLTAIPYIKNNYDISSYQTHIESLVESNFNNKDNIKILYERLKEIESPIRKTLPDNQIHAYFNATKDSDEFYYDLICMRIARLNNFHQNFRPLFNNILNVTDASTVNKVTERIEYYMDYGTILLNLNNMNHPLYIEVAKKLTTQSYRLSKINVLEVLQNYASIRNALGLDAQTIIERLNEWAYDAEKQITNDNVNEIPVDFFEDIVDKKNKLASCCIKVAKEYLASKTKDEWKQFILASESYEYDLLMVIKPKIQNCFDAFKELLVENATTPNSTFSKDKCRSIIELSESNGREMLTAFNDVRDRFCSGTGTMTNEGFTFYGEWLLKYSKLEEKPSSLRTIFTSSILDNKDNVQLILRYQEKMIKIVEIAGAENKDFKDKIKSLLDGEYKDDKAFEEFAKTIGINKSFIDKLKDGIGV